MKATYLYFLGGLNECQVVDRKDLPRSARYICTTDRYDVYDGEYVFYAVRIGRRDKPYTNKMSKNLQPF